jgi:hypothetical protein
MKKSILHIIFILFLFSCKKEAIDVHDLVTSLTLVEKTIDADGTSLVNVTAEINKKADASKRNVVFKTSKGDFVTGSNGTITKKAELEGDKLIARVQYRAPLVEGSVTISAKLDLPDETQEYWLVDSVFAKDSKPDRIDLSASAFAVMIDFGSEITITGNLLNVNNKPVSVGYVVEILDRFQNSTPVNGRFRDSRLVTNGIPVSVIYSPGGVTAGQVLNIIAIVKDRNGSVMPIRDTVFINTIPK